MNKNLRRKVKRERKKKDRRKKNVVKRGKNSHQGQIIQLERVSSV